VVWCGVVWCGVVWCGVVWCGVVWCGVVWFAPVCSCFCLCDTIALRTAFLLPLNTRARNTTETDYLLSDQYESEYQLFEVLEKLKRKLYGDSDRDNKGIVHQVRIVVTSELVEW
jgi:hypothetical protein